MRWCFYVHQAEEHAVFLILKRTYEKVACTTLYTIFRYFSLINVNIDCGVTREN